MAVTAAKGARPPVPVVSVGMAPPTAVTMTAVYALCGLPAAAAVAASVCLEAMHAHSEWVTAYLPLAALACTGFAAAVALTHSVPGHLLHPGAWQFYQPLRGGWRFILLQLLSWLSLTAVLAATAVWLYLYGAGAVERHGLWTAVAIAGVLAESFMVASIKTFDAASPPPSPTAARGPDGVGTLTAAPWRRHRHGAAPAAAAAAAAGARRRDLGVVLQHDLPWLWRAARASAGLVADALRALRMLAVLAFLSNTQTVLAVVIVAPFCLLPMRTAATVFVLGWSLYGLTYRGRPEKTGSRRWEAFKRSFLFQDLVRWFDGEIVVDRPLDQHRPYIFGFAPHGIMPLTASWLTHHATWSASVTKVETVVLGATVFQMVPILRDIALWAGTRAVSRDTFAATVAEGKSVLLIPGGMAEMRLSRSADRHIRLVTYHKGFVVMALRTGTPLVPVYSFGETRYFDQLELFGLSRLLHRTLGVPLPYFRGILGWIPLPRRERVRVVVGQPIDVPKVADPSPALVDQYAALFYASVHDLFERYKGQFDHGDCTLDISYRLHGGAHFVPGSATLIARNEGDATPAASGSDSE